MTPVTNIQLHVIFEGSDIFLCFWRLNHPPSWLMSIMKYTKPTAVQIPMTALKLHSAHQITRFTKSHLSVIRHSLCLRWRADWHQTPMSSHGLTRHGSLYPRRTEQVHGTQIHHLSARSASSILRDYGRDRGVCQELLQVRKCGVLKSCPTRLVESSNCQHNMGTVHVYYT